MGQYVKPIQQVAVLRLLQQLSQAYSSMRVSALAKMVPFMPFDEVELLIVDSVKAGFLQVRPAPHLHVDDPSRLPWWASPSWPPSNL